MSESSLRYEAGSIAPRPLLEMNRDFDLWKLRVGRSLEQLGMLTPQPEPDSMATRFGDIMEGLYGEGQFAVFVSSRVWLQAGLGREVGESLRALEKQLDNYDEPETDQAFVEDPAWYQIQVQARKVAMLLKNPPVAGDE